MGRDDAAHGGTKPERKPIGRFRWMLLGLVGLITIAALGVRYFAVEEGRPTGDEAKVARTTALESSGGAGFLPGTTTPAPPPEPTPREKAEELAPMITEAGLFAFLGFAIGYTARKAVKIGMVLIAIFFVALQGLASAGIVSVDWSRGLELLNQLVMNTSGGKSFGEVLQHHIPSAGSLAGGYLLGFRRG
ncbi:MAG: hypothetical protein IPN34_26070 [Planctomycetes bacterium]|nr:hypothetical protein [Planctomycetota bacterium]